MARKAKPSSRTSIQFVAADDEAIGVEPEGLTEAYSKYMQDMDERGLKLKDGVAPSYYHLRVLPLDLQAKIRDALTVDGDDVSPMDAFLSPVGKQLLNEFVNRCLMACDGHPYVDRINPDGSFESRVLTWAPGDNRPNGLVEAITAEEMLAINMFWFVFRASQLTEAEKKP